MKNERPWKNGVVYTIPATFPVKIKRDDSGIVLVKDIQGHVYTVASDNGNPLSKDEFELILKEAMGLFDLSAQFDVRMSSIQFKD